MMSDLPTIDDATEAVKEHAQGLVPWLPDPKQCTCGAYCEAKTEYVAEQVVYTDVWVCPQCDTRYYRYRE
jgi:hypothetical protein